MSPGTRLATDRDLLKPGLLADVVVFNADTVQDRSTYTDPHHYSEGVVHVQANVRWSMHQLLETPEGKARMAEGAMKLVGAISELRTGRVRLLP